jgi:hypothetical protein
MLFDLRGRGRRGTVRVLYIGLALLIGLGLVGFGVGGGFGGGGILNATSGNEATGGASFASQIKKYEKETNKNPQNTLAWENLTKALLHEAGNEGYVNSNGTPTTKGKELYRRASVAWNSYLGLNPKHTSPELAQLIYRIYSEEGLNEPARAVQALQIIVESRPTAAYYSQLAIYAYKAKNESVGDLASEKAVSLAPSTERTRLKNELAEAKKYPHGGQSYTTTTNGKIFRLQKSANGEYTGTQIGTTPAPATTTGTSTTKK